MKSLLRTPSLTLTISLAVICQFPVAYAEEKTVEVKSGDTLSTLIAEHYPSYKNSKALMQALLEANPASFKNQNMHQLIVGKTLKLPDPSKIPDLQAHEPPVVAAAATATSTATTNSAATDSALLELQNQLKRLTADKEQLSKQVKELSEAATKAAVTVATPAAQETDTPDPAILMQQLDQIETANEQILADKNKLLKEQEDLKQQLQTLETDKKQLETKLAEQAASITATPATATPPETESAATAAEALDPAILNQQLDEIESANEQLLTDKKQLEQERDQLKQQLQTLQAENKQAEASSTPPVDTASVNPDAPDPTILTQQLDEIEAANEQLLADKNKLQSDLETAQQQLKEREQTMSVLSGQITENKQQLETTQQELLLANAARASAELNKASLENQRGSWWPWLLALAMLPLGWLLGRRSATPTAQAPKKIPAASSVSSAPVAATAVAASELPNPELVNELPALESFSPVTSTLPALAANDDNLDAAIKLDIVRAYLDLRDPVAASALLKEIMREGGQQQQQEAREILSFLA